MKYFTRYISFILSILLLQSCVNHKAYVQSCFEPIVVKEKGETQSAITIRPFDYLNIDVTHAFANHIAVKTSIGGTYQLYNGMASFIYFNNYKSNRYFIAPFYNYQNNQLDRPSSYFSGFFGIRSFCKYNSVFHSLGLALGYIITSTKVEHHFMLKPQYNFVERYQFEFQSDNGSGKNSGFQIYEDEQLNKTIPSFFSIEPTYAFLIKGKTKNYFKIQVSLNLCEVTYTNYYTFNKFGSYGGAAGIANAKSQHPRSWPINLSVGFIFTSKKEPKI